MWSSVLGSVLGRSDKRVRLCGRRAAILANHTNDCVWEILAQFRQIVWICALFTAYTGVWTWKAIGDRLQGQCYLSRNYHHRKIRARKQRIDSLIHSVICLTTGPKPPPKRFLYIVQSRASSFKWQYPLLSLRSSSSFLRPLPRLLVTSISPFIFPTITCLRRQFLRKMWPIQLAFRFLISCRIFLCSLTENWYRYYIYIIYVYYHLFTVM